MREEVGSEKIEVNTGTPWGSRGSAGAQNGFEQLPLRLETYAALGMIDEEIYSLRKSGY